MTRIIAGAARGTSLTVPKSGTRPTSDKVREAIFSKLSANGALQDAKVLDVFAGSGALAFEALSRDASSADLVDNAAVAINHLKINKKAYQKMVTGRPQINIVKKSAIEFVKNVKAQTVSANYPWDLVFIDPPYKYSNQDVEQLLDDLHPLLDEDAWLVIERSARDKSPTFAGELWEVDATKEYGETVIYYLRPAL